MECPGGAAKTEVAARYGVSRQTVHAWLGRYASDGLRGLEDRSHRPHQCPHRIDAEVEALVCELRQAHQRWGPRRLRFKVGRRGVDPLPARATVYRILRRNNLSPGRFVERCVTLAGSPQQLRMFSEEAMIDA